MGDEERIRAAVGATLAAGTAYFEMLLESVDVTRSRSQGVCDFAGRREAGWTVTDLPEGVPDVFQIVDGGVVHSRIEGEWHAVDMGAWASASVVSELGWLYGTVDARADGPGEHAVTLSAEQAVRACPAAWRDELRTAFAQSGHLDAVTTGRVRTDAANRVTECRLEFPGGTDGLFGSTDVRGHVTLTLSDFGEPAFIRPPDGAGPAQPIGDYMQEFRRRAEGTE